MRLERTLSARAFTLVEILIVVVILGILAAVVIPQFTNARVETSVSTLKSQLQTIRGQIEVYKARHNSLPPFGTTGTESDWDPLVNPTDENTYLLNVPYNPFTNSPGIGTVDATDIGWVWDDVDGVITAPYFDEITNTYSPPGP
ncbi:MAG: prepilin-type N-terminal cleavage/methylation domain-containing protein [Phycisphaerales bacterium]|nr:prepilin-type N-terminal cleavage/methylation domain-containing protein [Phycisphaerales bacterium]